MKRIMLAMCAVFSVLSARIASAGDLWGYCNKEGSAFSDAGFTTRKPEFDKLCLLPTSSQTGVSSVRNTVRCLNASASMCSPAALTLLGIKPDGFGDNDVPPGAWFKMCGESRQFPTIRCGC